MNFIDTAAAAPKVDRSTVAALTYIIRQDEKPYFLSSALTGGEPEIHFQSEERETPVRDMREIAANIEQEGFELLDRPSAVSDFYDFETVDAVYNAEVTALLKERFGASDVHIFDHTRRSDSASGAVNPDGARGPDSVLEARQIADDVFWVVDDALRTLWEWTPQAWRQLSGEVPDALYQHLALGEIDRPFDRPVLIPARGFATK